MSDYSFARKKNYSENWPLDENGTPEEPVFLQHVSRLDVELTRTLLEAYSIPVLVQFPRNGEFSNVMLGFSAEGVDIYVPKSAYQEAVDILSATIIDEGQ